MDDKARYSEIYSTLAFVAIKQVHSDSDGCDCWVIYGTSRISVKGMDSVALTPLAELASRDEMEETITMFNDMVTEARTELANSVQADIDAL